MTTTQEFKQRIWELAELVEVHPKEIHLRHMTRKWGSCSSRGRLTYNKDIIEESEEIQIDAILHELLHLKYPNHGKMFHVMMRVWKRKCVSTRTNPKDIFSITKKPVEMVSLGFDSSTFF